MKCMCNSWDYTDGWTNIITLYNFIITMLYNHMNLCQLMVIVKQYMIAVHL